MGYILWDVFGSHFGFFKKRWEFPLYFWTIRLVNSQLALYSHVRCKPPWHPPETPPNTPTWQLQISVWGLYLRGVICNIVVKADLGRWTPQGIEQRCLEYQYTKIGRWTYFGWWTPQGIKNRCLEYCYTKCGRWTYFGQCYWHLLVMNGNFTLLLTSTGQEWQFHIATDIYWSRMAISHCYWHILVRNGNFTLLLTSSGQEWQFHIATDI